ncbi:MAG: helix-turn-helix domain-containing protein [Xanthomonadaceae bacterium]|nr:helix-turn-helix domain-containing protein [Xanthomonadaceae bacterium]MDP2185055.1 helix-turn-helix domain-containing protein [Xanthomonadales bacterium]MDZ4114434.1 helix-turn-helix domain-containing protein [Xanthomonadaceae bacterium]
MPTLAKPKKPAARDWHWKDVIAALHKAGWSLRQVSLAEGYPEDSSALGETARRPYPKAEAILARYIGVAHPMVIWPTRYDEDGQPNRRRGPAPMRGRASAGEVTTPSSGRNTQTRKAA